MIGIAALFGAVVRAGTTGSAIDDFLRAGQIAMTSAWFKDSGRAGRRGSATHFKGTDCMD
jgi:hypothetical protein